MGSMTIYLRGKPLLLMVSISLGALSCGAKDDQISDLSIIGGKPVANSQNDHRRWATVALTTDFQKDKSTPSLLSAGHSFCSGTLVGERTIVTAAHCLQKFDPNTRQKLDELILPNESDFVVSFSTEVNESSGWVRAAAVIPHPGWDVNETLSPNPTKAPNDLGVIILEDSAPKFARPAEIADTSVDPGTTIDLVGFGITSKREQNDTGIMRHVQTQFKTADQTAKRFSAGALMKGACAGDSGGPAYTQVNGEYQVMGATSTGAEIGGYCLGVLANYTDIRYYRDWIESH